MIISFGWTTPALLAGQKTVTRREWNPKHAAHFKAGQLVDAWNTSPRNVHGAPRKVAVIRLTAEPKLMLARQTPDADWEAEGFEYLSQNRLLIDGVAPEVYWGRWRRHGNTQQLYAVRFEVVEYLEGPLAGGTR